MPFLTAVAVFAVGVGGFVAGVGAFAVFAVTLAASFSCSPFWEEVRRRGGPVGCEPGDAGCKPARGS